MAAAPTLDEIKTAAQYAFTQGNYDDARTLDDLYKSQYTAQQPAAQPQQPVDPMAAYQAKVAADNAQPKDGPFEGWGAEFKRGIDQPLEQIGVTAETLGYGGVGQSLKDAVDAVPGESAASKFMEGDGNYNFEYLPKAAVGQVGQFLGSIATRIAGMGIGAAAGSVIPGAGTAGGAAVGAIAGPALFEGLQQLGPIALQRAENNGRTVPSKDDWIWASGTATGSGLLNSIAPGMSGMFKRAVVEGGTETAQSVVQQTGESLNTDAGLQVSPRDAVGEGLIGMGSAVAVDAALSPVNAAANLVSGGGSKPSTERESQARAAFSQRLASKVQASQNADGPAYDLSDVDADSRSGAKAAIDSAHSDMSGRLKTLVTLLKARLAPDKADLFDTVIEKSDASLAAVKAKNKVKNVVDVEDFANFEALVGDTAEGQEAINLMHEMNELTRVYSNGLTGGLSRFTDNLNPFGGSANYSGQAAQKAIAPYASLAGFMASPALTAAQVSGFVGGRAIDKLTGRRSRVANYVAQNQGNPGQRQPTGPSLRDQEVAERQAEEARIEQEKMQAVQQQQEDQAQQEAQAAQQAQNDADLDERIYNQGGMPAAGGPEGTLSSVLGLDTEQLMNLLDQVIETEPNPELVDAAIAAQQSIVRGGTVPNLTRLIRILKPRVNPDPQFWIERERGAAQQGAQVKLSRQEENYQRGIENNRKAAAALSDELNADDSVSKLDKALMLKALQDLQLDLGLNPVATLDSMYKRLQEQNVSPEAIEKYLAPYIERVTQQQVSKQEVLTAQDEVQQLNEPMDSRSLGAPVLEETTEQRKQRAEEQGYDTSTVYYHGTAADFDSFSKGELGRVTEARSAKQAFFFSDSSRTAQSYAHNTAVNMPVLEIIKDANAAERQGDFDKYDALLGEAEALEASLNAERRNGQNIIPVYLPNDDSLRIINMRGRSFDDFGVSDEISEELKSAKRDGLKGVKFLNFNDSAGLANDSSTHVAIFEPSNIRSVNAQFDPAKTESAQLTDSRALGAPALEMDSPQLDLPFGKPDVIPNMARPTPANTKDSMPKAQEAFEVAIGKPGSKFEKGVSTEADILQIAEILNIFPRIFDNRGDYLAASGKSINDTSLGNFADIGDSFGETRVLAAGVRSPGDGKPITNLEYLITLVHENIGHALESRSPGNGEAEAGSMGNNHPDSGGRSGANRGSLRSEIGQVLAHSRAEPNDFNKRSLERARQIRSEIESIQDQTEVFFEANPELGTSFLRDSPIKWEKQFIAEMKGEGLSPESTANLLKMNRKIYQEYYSKGTDYKQYKRNNAEFSVDPVILYVMNPTLMKKVAPETAKMIRDHFNSSKIPVSFHANPIVTVLAIIMAGVAQMEDDEEEKKNPGALTPQPGALTA